VIRALFGGSFDPVHDGHVALANHLLSSKLTDVVHVVPAAQSPHKNRTHASAHHRLAMVRLAFADTRQVVIEPCEIQSDEPCFTAETLRSLQNRFPAESWALVIGADHFSSFDTWHAFQEILSTARLIVVNRPGWELGNVPWMSSNLSVEMTLVRDFTEKVSASGVRQDIAATDLTASQLSSAGLPESVAHYIIEHQLYRPLMSKKDGNCE